MKVVLFFHRKQLLCFSCGMFVGILAGVSVFSLLVSYRMDGYYHKIRELELANEEKETRLQRLEESVDKTKYILKKVEVFLIYEGDELDKIALEKCIKEKYDQLLGKEVGSIDIDLVAEVIDDRIIKLDDKEYRLKLKQIILTEVLKIRVGISLVE
jgi:hypothetical protein